MRASTLGQSWMGMVEPLASLSTETLASLYRSGHGTTHNRRRPEWFAAYTCCSKTSKLIIPRYATSQPIRDRFGSRHISRRDPVERGAVGGTCFALCGSRDELMLPTFKLPARARPSAPTGRGVDHAPRPLSVERPVRPKARHRDLRSGWSPPRRS
jgi:hypothetical protein